jgi:hypothetical protein
VSVDELPPVVADDFVVAGDRRRRRRDPGVDFMKPFLPKLTDLAKLKFVIMTFIVKIVVHDNQTNSYMYVVFGWKSVQR